jgi:tRNA threonylcarbamoyladenosine biosynthesis protein TsaB
MNSAGATFSDIDRVAVTVGPGSFTGLRVGLAFAKGLALALGRPCVGIGTLEALAFSIDSDGWRVAAINAGRGQLYWQIFSDGRPVTAPDVLPFETAVARILEVVGYGAPILIGPGASELAKVLPASRVVELTAPLPEAVARLGAQADLTPARPMYLRAPDAKAKSR